MGSWGSSSCCAGLGDDMACITGTTGIPFLWRFVCPCSRVTANNHYDTLNRHHLFLRGYSSTAFQFLLKASLGAAFLSTFYTLQPLVVATDGCFPRLCLLLAASSLGVQCNFVSKEGPLPYTTSSFALFVRYCLL